MRDTAKVIIFLCISFLLVTLEDHCANVIPFASLIAVMTIGVSLQQKNQALSLRLSLKFNKLWVGAEIILFVLVGATVDLRYLKSAGGTAVLLLLLVLPVSYTHLDVYKRQVPSRSYTPYRHVSGIRSSVTRSAD